MAVTHKGGLPMKKDTPPTEASRTAEKEQTAVCRVIRKYAGRVSPERLVINLVKAHSQTL